ncbi:MAG TPA: hypothetical protein PLI09_08580 [Candidatus Hydrogenedentes bacterium]|nr:hypothetical protein [Candidatus Hydrogenedentota bacterium]
MAMQVEEEFKTFGEEFLAQYPRNEQGGFDGVGEDMVAKQRIGWCLKEVEEGEIRMFQESATMRFVG